jgi:hypothetical protein
MAEVPRFEEDKFFPDDDSKEFYAYYWVEGITPEWAYDEMEWYEENGGEPEDWTRWLFMLHFYEWYEDDMGYQEPSSELLLTASGSFDKHIDSGLVEETVNAEFDFNLSMRSELKEFYLSDSFLDFQRFVNGINKEVTKRLNIHLMEELITFSASSNLINWNRHPPQV